MNIRYPSGQSDVSMDVMESLPDEVRDRVSRLNADLLLDLLSPEEAVWLACDLLVAGIDTPALRELAGESPTGLTLQTRCPWFGTEVDAKRQ
ncbi:hypothetical protein [Nocardia sp. NPDC052566]|uniref:hypothetical protein n=1 Tax=Nocardia sp. NPDC052566 TaxID=3364330 RepID=UPI0037C64951